MRQRREKYVLLPEVESWSSIPQAVTKPNELPWVEIIKLLSYLHRVLEGCFIEEKTEEVRTTCVMKLNINGLLVLDLYFCYEIYVVLLKFILPPRQFCVHLNVINS
jgi:hypothetical protein